MPHSNDIACNGQKLFTPEQRRDVLEAFIDAAIAAYPELREIVDEPDDIDDDSADVDIALPKAA